MQTKYGIRVEDGDTFKEYLFSTKKQLLDTAYLQNVLEKFKSNDKANFQKITCLCKVDEPLIYLSSKKIKDKYYLANFPHNPTHDLFCPFYSSPNSEDLIDDDGRYSSKIFAEPEDYKDRVAYTPREIEAEGRRSYTYQSFCRDIVSDATVHAFNTINKDTPSRGELKNVTQENFIASIYNQILNKESMHNDKTPQLSLPPQHKFKFGIIHDDLFSNVDENKKVHNMKLDIFESKQKFKKGSFSIFRNKMVEIRKKLTIFNHIIKPPYFYIAITKPHTYEYNSKTYYTNTVVRFFIEPVAIYNDNIAFVESNKERNYAEYLMLNQKPFIKPYLGNEIYRIKKKFAAKEMAGNKYKYFNFNNYRPDFIEFYKNEIKIVEVAGYSDEVYLKSLHRKMDYFEEEAKKHNYFFRPTLVDR